jgi:S-adenosylmethionine hydrolase
MSALGNPLTCEDITLVDLAQPCIHPSGHLTGEIVSTDHFGNLITNIDRPTFCRVFCESAQDIGDTNVLITTAGTQIQGISTSYSTVAKGKLLGIFGSRDVLEISINRGNAKSYLNAKPGQKVTIIPGN